MGKVCLLLIQMGLEVAFAVFCIALLNRIFLSGYTKDMEREFQKWVKKTRAKMAEEWEKEHPSATLSFLYDEISWYGEDFRKRMRYELDKEQRSILLFIILLVIRRSLIWFVAYQLPWL